MGKRGPKPKPTAIKLLHGNRSKRPLNLHEPKPSAAPPRCPAWLDAEAKACWRVLIPQLRDMGVLTRIDANALTNYCETWSRWKRAVLFLQKNGDVYSLKDDQGNPKCVVQWPQVAVARNLVSVLHRYQQEFGLTPSARTSLKGSAVPGAIDEFDEFVNRRRIQKYGGAHG